MQYLARAGTENDSCFLCDAAADAGHSAVVHRRATAFVIMNAFPYNSGHVMVAPHRHAGELGDLSREERAEIMDLVTTTIDAVRLALKPDGFNVGINLGAAAGAGVPGHVHVHVVPRWSGDTNFMPVTGETKVLPESLDDTAAKLRAAFESAT